MDMWPAIVGVTAAIAIAVVLSFVAVQRRRRAARRAWVDYFQRGGLASRLVQRWSHTPRLTDQRKGGDS
ncbi:hypothetical protein D9601_12780 [Sphingomonas sp. MA1305]|uniref:hypothetical protein n=1 Tax=Sphingomonas sp. MA1305 TaxID=2479204 RepID=UPI0018DF3512|nr:hypothetical protein [Sphingomonas sp. MA1305]MBI0476222.1 hypothetical protein [Sphingomonas sp. MA1305]